MTRYSYDVTEIDGQMSLPNKYSTYWFQTKKPELAEINPLINLPYVRDGDLLISQSNACLLYLGRKFNLLGATAAETSFCEQLLMEIMELRENMVAAAYEETVTKTDAEKLLHSAEHGILPKLEAVLRKQVETFQRSGAFLVGEVASAPDFHLFEMMEHHDGMAEYYGLRTVSSRFKYLGAFKEKFRALPGNTRYFASNLYQLPFNNKYAGFGATLTRDKWTVGMEYGWGSYSGLY